MRKPSRLSEVAKLAGVAPITASRAIRGEGYVSEEARARIMEAAAKLNYAPDMVARRMRGEKSRLIGIFVNNFGSLVLHEITKEISHEARARGYDILLFSAERFDGVDRAGTRDMLANLCAGLILPMPNVEDGYLAELERRQLPCVFVNFDARPMALPVVVVENRNGARLAVEHLLSLGHRRIAFIAGSPYTGQSGERQAAYVDALNAAGIAVDPALIVPGRFVQTGGHAATQQLLDLLDPPTAIFAANDEMAFGAIDAIHSRGLRVPADISVIGFDDIATSSHIHPPLTTLRQPLAKLSASAVGELVALIEGRGVEPRRIALPLELIVRESTGPAPARR
ncbi:LacI family DNA-binding transcriptional regulator [Roseateles cellulosilyticus]|uniref:LacI family transcriptional regulator n=1 Tax=Pelomonas cellulosilytica TaxID=2906762 RepID=A0ABS8XMC5_9BURK|nr:LacI family DNA-binding transcriptional regulator [Pelomonas sp. P8]MCE4553937.1 LacI family transcriptional regulator [Pelomonas sp. P8]